MQCSPQGDNLFHLLGSRFLPDGAAYMLAAAAVMIPTVWLPSLKALSYLGVCGITATTTVATTVSCLESSPSRCCCPRVSNCCMRPYAVHRDRASTGVWLRVCRSLTLCSAGNSRPVPIAP